MLQVRQKWHDIRRNLAKDDIVLVVDEIIPTGCCPIEKLLKQGQEEMAYCHQLELKQPSWD